MGSQERMVSSAAFGQDARHHDLTLVREDRSVAAGYPTPPTASGGGADQKSPLRKQRLISIAHLTDDFRFADRADAGASDPVSGRTWQSFGNTPAQPPQLANPNTRPITACWNPLDGFPARGRGAFFRYILMLEEPCRMMPRTSFCTIWAIEGMGKLPWCFQKTCRNVLGTCWCRSDAVVGVSAPMGMIILPPGFAAL
jgi:hypothetical protein